MSDVLVECLTCFLWISLVWMDFFRFSLRQYLQEFIAGIFSTMSVSDEEVFLVDRWLLSRDYTVWGPHRFVSVCKTFNFPVLSFSSLMLVIPVFLQGISYISSDVTVALLIKTVTAACSFCLISSQHNGISTNSSPQNGSETDDKHSLNINN